MAVSVALDHLPPTNTATGRSPRHPCQGQIPRAIDHVACHFTSVRSQERSLQTNLALLLVEVRYVLSLRSLGSAYNGPCITSPTPRLL